MTRPSTAALHGLKLSFLDRRLVVDYEYPGTIDVRLARGVRSARKKDAATVELGRLDHATGAWFEESRWTWNAAKAASARVWVQNVLAAHESQRSRSYEHDGELVLLWHQLPTRTSEQGLLAAGFRPILATWRAVASERRRDIVRAMLAGEAVTPGPVAREQTQDTHELTERAQHTWMRWFSVFRDSLGVGGRTYKVDGRPTLDNGTLLIRLNCSGGTSLHVRLDLSKHPLRHPVKIDGDVTFAREAVAWEDFPGLATEIDAILSARKKAQRKAGRGERASKPVPAPNPRQLAELPAAGPTPPGWADRLVDAFNADAGPQLAFSRRRGIDTIVFVIHAEERPDRVLAAVDVQDEELEDIRWLDDLTPAQQSELTERLERALAELRPEHHDALARAALEKLKARALALGADPDRLAGNAGREEYRWLAETLRDLAEPRGTDGDDLAAWLVGRSLKAAAKHVREFTSEESLDEFFAGLWEKLEDMIVLVPVGRDGDDLVVDPNSIFESDRGPAILLREPDADGRPREVLVRLREECEDTDCRIESNELSGGERAWHLGIEWDHRFIRELYRKVGEFEHGLRTAPDRLADIREMLFWAAAMIDTPRCRGESRRVAEAAFRAAKEHYDRARALVARGDSAEGLAALRGALRKIVETATKLAESCAAGQATLPGTSGEIRAEMRVRGASVPWKASRVMMSAGRPQGAGRQMGARRAPSTIRVAAERLVATLPRPDLAPLRIVTRTPRVRSGSLVVVPLHRAEATRPEDRYVLALHLPNGQGFMFRFQQLADPAADDLRDPDRLYPWSELDIEAVVLTEGLDWHGVAAVLGIDPAEIDATVAAGEPAGRT